MLTVIHFHFIATRIVPLHDLSAARGHVILLSFFAYTPYHCSMLDQEDDFFDSLMRENFRFSIVDARIFEMT